MCASLAASRCLARAARRSRKSVCVSTHVRVWRHWRDSCACVCFELSLFSCQACNFNHPKDTGLWGGETAKGHVHTHKPPDLVLAGCRRPAGCWHDVRSGDLTWAGRATRADADNEGAHHSAASAIGAASASASAAGAASSGIGRTAMTLPHTVSGAWLASTFETTPAGE